MIWGGTGWEALASGKPFLQAFHFSDGEFEKLYGYPPTYFKKLGCKKISLSISNQLMIIRKVLI